jgi:hypothetical protein
MARILVCAVLVVSLAAGPALAGQQDSSGGGDFLWDLLNSLFGIFNQFRQWVLSTFNNAIDSVRAKIAPITDTYYAANSIAEWLRSLAGGLPTDLRDLMNWAISRFSQPAEPPAGSVQDITRKVVREAPDSSLAQELHAREELSAATDTSVTRARAAQDTAEDVAEDTVEDKTMAENLEVASQAAQELAQRAQNTPSTRAAVQLLVEGFAAFMDQQARQNADISGRITSLVQQQAALSQQLTSVTEQAAALVELMNQREKREMEQSVVASRVMLSSAIEGVGAGLQGIASIAPGEDKRRAEDTMYQSFTKVYAGR